MNVSALDARTDATVDAAPPQSERSLARPRELALLTAGAAVLMAGALVLSRRTGLWLDEAQSVAIARKPLSELVDALRIDGAPPLYYVLLHGWMKVFGEGDLAVRSLSAVFAVATVPMTVLAARVTLGRRSALLTGGLLLTMPFLYRYGTETRMYALVMLLVALGWWLAVRERHVALAAVVGLLLLTHYWSFFLVATGFVVLLWMRRRATAIAVAAGGLFFLPWVPTFVYQTLHTGAPWGARARLGSFDVALAAFGGGAGKVNMLSLLYVAAAVLAVRHTEIGWRLLAAAAGPIFLGSLVSFATGAAFAERYAAIAFVPFVLLVVAGVRHVGTEKATRIFIALLAVFGLVNGGRAVWGQRSQSPAIAAALQEDGLGADDLVVFCPDQLAPAVTRLLPDDAPTWTYPLGDRGDVVNWVDYKERNAQAAENDGPKTEAKRLHETVEGNVWFVYSTGYRTYGRQCTQLIEELREYRPGDERIVKSKRSSYERATLWKFRERD